MLTRRYIHAAKLPSLDRIAHAFLEAQFLLLVVDRKPVLHEDDARANQHLFEKRARARELTIFIVATEAHDALNTSAVVPAAIEQDDLAGRWQFRDIALEIPLPTLLLARRWMKPNTQTPGKAQTFRVAMPSRIFLIGT